MINKKTIFLLCGIFLFHVVEICAQDTKTLYRALLQLETSIGEIENSLKKAIEDEVKSQQNLLGDHEDQLVVLQKELSVLKGQVSTKSKKSEAPNNKAYLDLEVQVEFLKRSIKKLSDSHAILSNQLNGRDERASSQDNSTTQQDLFQKYEQLSTQMNALVDEVENALGEHNADKTEADEVPAAEHALLDKFSIDGYLRFKGNGYSNYDLNSEAHQDNLNDFITVRSFVNMHVQQKKIKALLSLNLAGSEFDDGFFWGNDNPAQVRDWNASIQYLYLDYAGFLDVRVGRMPAGFGNSIVAHTTRDGVKLTKKVDDFVLSLVWFKGGEGISQEGFQDASFEVVNDSTGHDHDLDALVLPLAWNYAPESRAQFVFARLFDSRADQGFPEKMFLDLNVIGRANGFSYAAEVAFLRGETAFISERRRRLAYDAFMIYLKGVQSIGTLSFGNAFGMGSGDKNPADSKVQNFQNLFMDETGHHFTHLFSDDLHGYTGRNSDLAKGSGFGNVMFYQLVSMWRPYKGIDITLTGTILRTTEPRDVGTGIFGTNLSENVTHNLGKEIDAGITVRVAEQSHLFLSGAVFMPGEVYENQDLALKLETGIAVVF